MVWKFLIFVLTGVVLHYLAHLGGKLFPRDPEVDLSDVPPDVVVRTAIRINRIGTGGAIVFFLLLVPGWILGAYFLETWLRPRVAAEEFVVAPLFIGRIFRSMAAAYVLAALLAMWLARLIIGPNFYLSLAAGNEAYGFRAGKFFYVAWVWIMPGCVEYELHAMGTYALVTRAGLVERHSLLGWSQTHSWNQLTRIELDKPYNENRAEIFRSPELRLTFGDGHAFTDDYWLLPYHPGALKPSTWEDVCLWASAASGKPIEIVAKIE